MLAQESAPRRDAVSTEVTPRRPLREGERIDVWFTTRTSVVRRGDYAVMRGVFTVPRLGIRREFDAQTEPARCSARADDETSFTFHCMGDTRVVRGSVTVDAGALTVEFTVQGEGMGGRTERMTARLPPGVRVRLHGGSWRL